VLLAIVRALARSRSNIKSSGGNRTEILPFWGSGLDGSSESGSTGATLASAVSTRRFMSDD
jgi:hypothetical protein